MTTLPRDQREWTFRRMVAELPFIPATSNWLKLLLSLLAEPLMFASSLCIIAQTVLPGASTWPGIFTNGTKTVMSLAPEIILPGCFQQAHHAHHNGNVLKGNMLLCLCALFGLLTLVTLASFIWHFSGAIDNLILFIRCGAGISYTIILNISGQDEQPTQPPQAPPQRAQDDHLTEAGNTLVTQLTTVLPMTQNNNFLVSPLQESPQTLQLGEAPPHSLNTTIHPLRLNALKGQANLHLLTLVAQQTGIDPDEHGNASTRNVHVEVQEEQRTVVYPVVAGVSAEKVRQLIDAFLRGVKWRDMSGNYSQTIKPVREAWERLHATIP